MTVCNMSIEAGARAGMVAPDETTFAYLEGRPLRAARARCGTQALAFWKTLPSTRTPRFDREVTLDAAELAPDRDLGHQPAGRAADHRPRARSRADAPTPRAARAWSARWPTWALTPGHAARRRSRSTACSSARAPTAASRTCARRRRVARRARRAVVPAWVVPGSGLDQARRRGGGARPRLPRGRLRVARGRAARCASA